MSMHSVMRELPEPEYLRRWSQAAAMIDALLLPQWELRTYSFDAHWAPGQQMASMRNGSGDAYYVVFQTEGVWLKGFDHESLMTPFRRQPPRLWPGLLEGVPLVFREHVEQPAFMMEETTFCAWRLRGEPAWQCGAVRPPGRDADGSAHLLGPLCQGVAGIKAYIREVHEIELVPGVVEAFMEGEPLSASLALRMNPALVWEEAREDARAIGYPVEDDDHDGARQVEMW